MDSLKLHLWEEATRNDLFTELAMEYGLCDDEDFDDLPSAEASDHFPAGSYAGDIERYLASLRR